MSVAPVRITFRLSGRRRAGPLQAVVRRASEVNELLQLHCHLLPILGDEVPYHRHGEFWRIGEYRVATRGEPLEAYKMGRYRGGDICLAFDRRHRIFLSAQHERRTLHSGEGWEQVERVAFSTRACEPARDLWVAESSFHHVRVARSARVEGKGETDPGLERGSIRVPVEKSATRQRADLWPAE